MFPHIESSFDLASVYSGGQAVLVSDQHYGVGSNLLMPGRGTASHTPSKSYSALLGKDMGDGWETRRSRKPSHKDWVIIKLCVINLLFSAALTSKV